MSYAGLLALVDEVGAGLAVFVEKSGLGPRDAVRIALEPLPAGDASHTIPS